ncbi:MAG: hypothetical protein Q7V58_01255 [Actinomycetota bacterium]|nr:hypothetical protein [Actinomycetota bacterium]
MSDDKALLDADPDVLPELIGFARPRWRDDVPILWRDPTTIQLGDDVIVPRVGHDHVGWLARLDGLSTARAASADLPIPAAEARRLLRGLLAAGALDDAARIPDAVRWARAEDRDLVAGRFGAVLRSTRDLDAAYAVMSAREAARVVVLGREPVLAEAREAMSAAGLGAAASVREANVAVVAERGHPDVAALADHDLPDLPHLRIGVLGDRAVVGPIVVPGRTSCQRCAHLHRRDADPAWPLLAVQWAQATSALASPPLDPLLVRAACLQAALLLREWCEAPDAVTQWGNVAIEVALPRLQATRVGRPSHPLCGCLWAAA